MQIIAIVVRGIFTIINHENDSKMSANLKNCWNSILNVCGDVKITAFKTKCGLKGVYFDLLAEMLLMCAT